MVTQPYEPMGVLVDAAERFLPQNVEAEMGVLGSLLISPEAITQVADFLTADDFYREAHQLIYQAVLDLTMAGQPADLITLTDELARRGHLEVAGGTSYVSSLANQVPTSRNIKRYAEIVERVAVLRRLIQAAGQIAAVAYNEPEAAEALRESEVLLAQVAERRPAGQIGKLGAQVGALLDLLEARQLGTVKVGTPTGFAEVDKLLGGFRAPNLLILGARPAVGKSALALTFAHHLAQGGHPVLFFSLEMSAEEVLERLLSMDAGVDLQRLRQGQLSNEEWARIAESATRLDALPLYVDDAPLLTVGQMRARTRRLQAELPADQPLALVIVDYLQLMQGETAGAKRGQENRTQEVSAISRGLKVAARELSVPVLALSQLSRAVETRAEKKPQMSDLRESGGIEADADIIMFLHRDEIYNPDTDRKHIADLIVEKHRNGPRGVVCLYFDEAHTRYRSLELRYATAESKRPAWNEGMDDNDEEDYA